MKLVYCVDHLFHVGGIEATTSLKANALVQGGMASVWILYTEQKVATPFALSPNVHLVDLGIRYSDNTKPFPWNLIRIVLKRRRHQKLLTRVLSQIRPDIVISTGGQEFSLIPRIKGTWLTIRELHTTKYFKRLFAQTWHDQIVAKIADWLNYERTIKRYDHLVVLTWEEYDRYWSGWNNVSVIPNPARFLPDQPSELSAKRILSVGRLSPEKNYSSLIRAFALVHSLFPDWSLDIFGDGDERYRLLSEIEKYHLNDVVHLPGSTNDVQKEMLSSSLLVCSSKYEGFSMVIIEAMSCGLPVVSYECPCGPKDLISDGNNGYLVPVGDENALADRICRLIENTERRKQMGVAAFETSKYYSLEQIISQWMALFEKLLMNKHQESSIGC
jgi:glycosyltransferase involved in cell wall biosynthesis